MILKEDIYLQDGECKTIIELIDAGKSLAVELIIKHLMTEFIITEEPQP